MRRHYKSLSPSVIQKHLSALQELCATVSEAVCLIFSSLSTSLQLKSEHRLEEMHRMTVQDLDIIRLLKYRDRVAGESGPSHAPHTDLGSLTFLFSERPGLQLKRPQSDLWENVEPRAGYAVVNVGDSLSMLSGGLFNSCLHRVGPPSSSVPQLGRHSFAYFCRAESDTVLRPLSSPLIGQGLQEEETFTSVEWLQSRLKTVRADSQDMKNHCMLTKGSSD